MGADRVPDPAADCLARHYDEVREYVARLVKSDLVDDVVQESYLRALRWTERNGAPRRPCQWLCAIATNVVRTRVCLEYDRGLWYVGSDDLDNVVGDDPIEELAEEEEHQAEVHLVVQCASRLSALEQQLLKGLYTDGLGCKLLAQQTGLSYGAVKCRLLRARGKMRSMVEAEERRQRLGGQNCYRSESEDGRR